MNGTIVWIPDDDRGLAYVWQLGRDVAAVKRLRLPQKSPLNLFGFDTPAPTVEDFLKEAELQHSSPEQHG